MDVQEAITETLQQLGICLKEKQSEAVSKFCSGHDVFVSLPTGFGKSIIYAILPLVFDRIRGKKGSMIVCVSPLNAIMIEQKDKFLAAGINAEFVGEAQKSPTAWRKVISGQAQLIYISPESIICNSQYRQMLRSPVYKENLMGIVFDEAHCIKIWGDDFRTAYASLGELRSIVSSNVCFMALTATATRATFEIIIERLSLNNPVVVGISPNRPNIFLSVAPHIKLKCFAEEIGDKLKSERLSYPKSIIFCRSYQDCANMYAAVIHNLGKEKTEPPGYPNLLEYRLVSMYTRASAPAMKEIIMSIFSNTKSILRVLIATTAFSMGIDIPDIHQVFHLGPPCDAEQYLQEIGRAGRDGELSSAILIHGKNRFVQQTMKSYCENKDSCRRLKLFKSFIMYEHVECLKCRCCDNCARSCNCSKCTVKS